MLIVTNPGSNLTGDEIAQYGIRLTPQQIIVDGTSHDTRLGVSHETIDSWVRTAKVHPYVVGTTAAEFVALFRDLSQVDRQILAVMTSRKIIGSHDAAVSAARTLTQMPGYGDVRIAVADTGSTDLGAGLACMLAAEAARAGRSLAQIEMMLSTYRAKARFVFHAEKLDYLVKGGRATAVRAWIANVLGVRPLIGFVDGEVKVIRKIGAKADVIAEVVAELEQTVAAGRPIWAGVMHGDAPTRAAELARALSTRFETERLTVRPLSPSIYLHGGPGCLGVAAIEISADFRF